MNTEDCIERGCTRVPAAVGYCPYHFEQYDQIVLTDARNRDEEDVHGQELVDVAHGMVSTAFIFERDDGSLTGIKVPTDAIEWKNFTRRPTTREASCSGQGGEDGGG